MKALTVIPKKANSLNLRDVPEPTLGPDDLLCDMLMVGICGTDAEIEEGHYGEAPPGSEYLIIGHESLGRVSKTPVNSSFKPGDLIAGFVRRPDPLPCPHCLVGEWDMCENGKYTERGIKGIHGYASEQFRIEEKYCQKIDTKLEKVGVLLEPTSVVAKAWEQSLRIASRSLVPPRTALIGGAGPVGLLAAMIGKQKQLEVHVFDHNPAGGPKSKLVESLGATYHSDLESLMRSGAQFDIMMECTGVPEVIVNLFSYIKSDGILCLAGVTSSGHSFPIDIGALNLQIVLQNQVIFGSVNANRRHYEEAHAALLKADLAWLNQLITRRIPLAEWKDGFQKQKSDIKVVLTGGSPRG